MNPEGEQVLHVNKGAVVEEKLATIGQLLTIAVIGNGRCVDRIFPGGGAGLRELAFLISGSGSRKISAPSEEEEGKRAASLIKRVKSKHYRL